MATITTQKAGNWTTGTTWVGNAAPSSTDDVVIAHAITVDTNIVIGSGGTAITVNNTGPGGTTVALTIADGNTLTVKGNVLQGDAPVTFGTSAGGSRLVFDTTTGTRKWLMGRGANQLNCNLFFNGTASAHCSVSKTGSNFCYFDSGDEGVGAYGNNGGLEATYTDFSDVTNSAGTIGFGTDDFGVHNRLLLHCTFTRCGIFFAERPYGWNGTGNKSWRVEDCVFRNPVTSALSYMHMFVGIHSWGSGTMTFLRNAVGENDAVGFKYSVYFSLAAGGDTKMQIDDCYFDHAPYISGPHKKMNRVTARLSSNQQSLFPYAGLNPMVILCDHVDPADRENGLTAVGNPHVVIGQVAGVFDGVIIDYPHAQHIDGGDSIYGNEDGSFANSTIQNCILVPGCDGVCGGNNLHPMIHGNNRTKLYHNTIVGRDAQLTFTERDHRPVGSDTPIGEIKSNLIIGRSQAQVGGPDGLPDWGVAMYDLADATINQVDLCPVAQITHNVIHNPKAYTDVATGQVHDGFKVRLSSIPNGTNQLLVGGTGANCVDDTRCCAKWAAYKGYVAASDLTNNHNRRAALDAVRAALMANPTLGDSDLRPWIRDGYAPQNVALQNAGHDGLTIGAVPFGSSLTTSPTGRTPKLAWTPAQQDIFTHMKADYDANPSNPSTFGGRLYKNAKTRADAPSGSINNALNSALWSVWMYQATGDVAYAQKYYADVQFAEQWRTPLENGLPVDNSGLQNNGMDWVLGFDWAYPGLTQPQRDTLLGKLNAWFLRIHDADFPLRIDDSDQVTGVYAALACFYYATRDYNPTAVNLWADPMWAGTTISPAGGLTSARNVFRYYMETMAAGGEWLESSMYNLNTIGIDVRLARYLAPTTAANDFPEIRTYCLGAAKRMIYMMTPDLYKTFQWGDEQDPHYTRFWDWQTTALCVVSALNDSDQERRDLMRHILDVDAAHLSGFSYTQSYGGSTPSTRCYPCLDPYATASPDFSALAKGWFAPGQGAMVFRTGHTATDSAFWAHMRPESPGVDHQVAYFGIFNLYRKGIWATHTAHGYSFAETLGSTTAADTGNGLVFEGLSAVGGVSGYNNTGRQFRRIVGQKFGTDYAYLCGTQGGSVAPELSEWATLLGGPGSATNNPPPAFLHEHTRTLLYWPSTDNTSDTVVTVDRVNADDPETLDRFSSYIAGGPFFHQGIIHRERRWAWQVHMPASPTIVGNKMSWSGWNFDDPTATAIIYPTRPSQAEILYPSLASLTLTAQDESTIQNTLGEYESIAASEKKWRVRVMPLVDQKWNVVVGVVSGFDSGKTVTSTLLSDTVNNMLGVHVARTGNDDRVAAFNAIQGGDLPSRYPNVAQCVTTCGAVRLRSLGYTLAWTQTTSTATVLLCDLLPSAVWSYRLDGGSSTSVTPDSNGLVALSVSGATGHSLVLTAAGQTPASGTFVKAVATGRGRGGRRRQ